MLLTLIAVVFTALIYWSLVRPHKYWARKGVPQGNPAFLLGDGWRGLVGKQSQAELIQDLYNIGPNKSRYCGTYQFLTPNLVIRDPELIKQVTVKDFDHFLDHRNFADEEADPLFGKNLLLLRGQKWRDMRSTLSPAFTSSKMKYMFSLISESGEQFANHFLKKDQDMILFEMKDTFTRFTNDVIANTAFGVPCDSLGEPDNEFYSMGKEATDFSSISKILAVITNLFFPRLARMLQLSLFSKEVGDFFTRLVRENLESREKHGIVRPDLINLLMEARKTGHIKHEELPNDQDAGFATAQESEIGKTVKTAKTTLTDVDITAQALVFFFAGFDSVSSLMCFMGYELGVNQDVQERLRQEVDETRQKCDGKLTYEALTSMKYMDMVTSESLRKWPNAVATDRVCTKPYTIEPKQPGEKSLHLEKGAVLLLPAYAIQRDPQYFPDPERFDPERFSDENKESIKPYTYFPFGIGPRNCIGSRFALLETKTLFFNILTHFEIVPVEKTQIPLKLSKKIFFMAAEGGLWFGLKRRRKL